MSEQGGPARRPARAITVADLLSHLSGLPFKSAIEEPTLDGRHGTTRILSEAAVDTMTQRHTPPNLEASYGFGWAVGDGTIGHGGAYSTLSTIHLGPGLITIFLVQQDGFAPGGDRCASDFEEAAVA